MKDRNERAKILDDLRARRNELDEIAKSHDPPDSFIADGYSVLLDSAERRILEEERNSKARATRHRLEGGLFGLAIGGALGALAVKYW